MVCLVGEEGRTGKTNWFLSVTPVKEALDF